MAVIQIRYSTTSGHTPTGLASGQIAINLADGILFWNDNNGVLKSFVFNSPLVATMGADDSSGHAASTSFVQGLLTALNNGAPVNLNTFGEIANALGNDPNFAQTVNNALVSKLRIDAAQSLNGDQLKQVWSNLGLGPSGTIDGNTALIQLKRSTVSGAVPPSLLSGEFSVNPTDELLYWQDANSVVRSMPLATAPIFSMASNNIIINGGMEVSQRFGTTVQTLTSGLVTYITDQWMASFTRAGAALSAYQNLSGSPTGFNAYLGMKVTSAIASYGSTDQAVLLTRIEGYRWSRLAYGTSSASPCTIGFWVYASVAGVATFSIRNDVSNRSYVQDFTVPAATWTWVVLTIPGDQAGTWQVGSSTGANLTWCFGAGSSFTGTNKTWTAGSLAATSNTTKNFFDTVNNYVAITGVVALPGILSIPAKLSPQLVRPYAEALDECLRYFERGLQPLSYRNNFNGITYAYDTFYFQKQKRVSATMSLTGWQYYSSGNPANFTPILNAVNTSYFEVLGQNLSNWMGWYHTGTWTANASL